MLDNCDDGRFLICMCHGQDDYDLGYYGNGDDAITIVNDLFKNICKGSSFYDMPKDGAIKTISLCKETQLEVLCDYGMATRCFHALKRAGYTTVEQVASLDSVTLGKVRNLGSKSQENVKTAIAKWRAQK